jgi:hypothetical protein
MPRQRDTFNLPVRCCSDEDVQRFVEKETRNTGPFSIPQSTRSARERLQAHVEQEMALAQDGR